MAQSWGIVTLFQSMLSRENFQFFINESDLGESAAIADRSGMVASTTERNGFFIAVVFIRVRIRENPQQGH